eukprot:CAMPEP_0172484008 /NCGR_PEP_ID=MMETSP1066-20121228/11258_1 /TAXON_ID=671091 /ORGANISM="Coscinodiscus wailesii, Strain CCMP2513" /LENGTH=269 /DNA_ID=CAMNT_0013248243 /DNA_START=103 /DNA_END=912 /DNA_ORIENTATION=+
MSSTSYTPLTDTQRVFVVSVHFLTFAVAGWTVWAIQRKLPILHKRIWSPFLLITGIIFLQLGAAFEIANHYYEGNFELKDMKTDFINGVFYFFNFGGNYLNVLGLRNKSVPFFRIPGFIGNCKGGCFDLLIMLFDIFMVVGIFITLPIYFSLGREQSISTISAFGAFAGIGILFRLWRNVGPNRGTLFGGIGFFIMAIVGVIMTQVYQANGVEFLHAFIGGSFVLSLIPFTIGILSAVELPEGQKTGEDEVYGEQDVAVDSVEMTSVPL